MSTSAPGDTGVENPADAGNLSVPDPTADVTQTPAPPAEQIPTPDPPAEPEFTAFDLNSVPEEMRPHVEAARRTMQADYSRKTAELAAQRTQAEQAIALQERLASEDTRRQALQELLDPYDLDLPEDFDPNAPSTPPMADQAGAQGAADPALEARLSAMEAAQQEREASQHGQLVEQAVNEGFRSLETELGMEPGTLPQHEQDAVLAQALALGVDPATGMPMMEQAQANYLALRSAITATEAKKAEAYLASKTSGAQVDTAGGSGVPAPTLPKSAQERQEAAMAIAGRHMA